MVQTSAQLATQATTLTIKVGSNVLTGADGKLNIARMTSLVAQIAQLNKEGHRVVLVSSGAMAAGRSMISGYQDLNPVAQRQLLASVGQVSLIDQYKELFDQHGLKIGQLLVTKQDLGSRLHYLNMKSCVETLWQNGVIPVVNENDAVSLTGLMFTDNDELSGLIAQMMEADMLVLLSNIDGIYTGNPTDPQSELIPRVALGRDLSEYIQSTKSSAGRGGMVSKYTTASRVQQAGIRVVIANGERENILVDLISNKENTPHTEFEI